MKINYMMDVAFTVEGEWESVDEIPREELIAGMERRLNYLKENPHETADAFGVCDQYEVTQ